MKTPKTLNEMLERAAGFPGAGLRLLDSGGREEWLPWSQVRRRAGAVCGGLRALGVAGSDRVALIFPTGAPFFDAFFGALLAGAVPVPLYPPVRLGRLEGYLARTGEMLCAAGAVLVLADGRVRRIIGGAIARARPELGCRTLKELPTGADEAAAVSEGDLALVQFSSGTTVAPKPVALSHRALVAQTVRLNGLWPERDGVVDSGVSWLPLYHDMGLIGCVFPALERPGVLTLLPPEGFVARPAAWLRAISRYRATISPAPNFAYGLCVDKVRDEELEGTDLSCWRVAPIGAEAVSPRVLQRFAERFSRWGFRRQALTPVYGLSEAALAVTFSDIEAAPTCAVFDRDALARAGIARPAREGVELVSVGRPLPDFALRIVDPQGAVLPAGRLGGVRVKGPSLMEGYLFRPEATAAVLCDGWLDTGDLGLLWQGELYVAGRAKEVLILRGRNHAPEELERALDAVEGVRRGCAVAVSWLPEGADGEKLILLVEAARGVSGSELGAIGAECSRAVLSATGLALDEVALLEPGTLPRTSSGKLRRREALRRYLDGSLQPPRRVTSLRMAAAMTRSSLAYALLGWERRDGSRAEKTNETEGE